jgi:hypothetical protein
MNTGNRYRVEAQVTISISTVVHARDSRHAIELARKQSMPEITEQGRHDPDPEESWITSGELDGEPKDLIASLEDDE